MEIKLFPDNQLERSERNAKVSQICFNCVYKLSEKVGYNLKLGEYDNLLGIVEGYVFELFKVREKY